MNTMRQAIPFYTADAIATPRKPWFRCFKVGGLRFLRIGRFQASFCIVTRS